MKRTENYVTTLDPKSIIDMEKLADIRKSVKATNQQLKWAGVRNNFDGSFMRMRVSVKGRLGKNNPNADKYRTRTELLFKNNKPVCRTNVETGKLEYVYKTGILDTSHIRLEDAQRFDIYIHRAA